MVSDPRRELNRQARVLETQTPKAWWGLIYFVFNFDFKKLIASSIRPNLVILYTTVQDQNMTIIKSNAGIFIFF